MNMTYTCKDCGFSLWNPIIGSTKGDLMVSHLGLYNDGRFPGRCILVFNKHQEELIEMNDEDLIDFMIDVKTVGAAIQDVLKPDRINYSILGNAVPHIHCHIIPRYHDKDPNPNSTPWSRNDKAWEMDKERRNEIISALQEKLIIK